LREAVFCRKKSSPWRWVCAIFCDFHSKFEEFLMFSLSNFPAKRRKIQIYLCDIQAIKKIFDTVVKKIGFATKNNLYLQNKNAGNMYA
jgi:hypothetical protein